MHVLWVTYPFSPSVFRYTASKSQMWSCVLQGSHTCQQYIPTNWWQYVATYVIVFSYTLPKVGAGARAVGDLSVFTLCILCRQPTNLQCGVSYFTGATRTDSISQLVTVCGTIHASVRLYPTQYISEPVHLLWVIYPFSPCVFKYPASKYTRRSFVLHGSHTCRQYIPILDSM